MEKESPFQALAAKGENTCPIDGIHVQGIQKHDTDAPGPAVLPADAECELIAQKIEKDPVRAGHVDLILLKGHHKGQLFVACHKMRVQTMENVVVYEKAHDAHAECAVCPANAHVPHPGARLKGLIVLWQRGKVLVLRLSGHAPKFSAIHVHRLLSRGRQPLIGFRTIPFSGPVS